MVIEHDCWGWLVQKVDDGRFVKIRQDALFLLIFSGLYYVAGFFGISKFSLQPENIAVLWLPSGIGLIMWLRFGWFSAPVLFAIDYWINLDGMLNGGGRSPYVMTALITIFDLGQSWLASVLFKKFTPKGLIETRDLLTFGFLVCLFPTALSGIGIATVLSQGGYISAHETLGIIRSLIFSDGLGILLIYPLFQAWSQFHSLSRSAVLWFLMGLPVLTVAGVMAFIGYHGMIYFILPILLGLTVYVGMRGATILLGLVVTGIVAHTAQHTGPFATEANVMDGYFAMMAFVYSMTITVLALAINQK